jgi:hypothetical protein
MEFQQQAIVLSKTPLGYSMWLIIVGGAQKGWLLWREITSSAARECAKGQTPFAAPSWSSSELSLPSLPDMSIFIWLSAWLAVVVVGGRRGIVVGVVVIQKATPRQKAWGRTAPGAPGKYQILRNHITPIKGRKQGHYDILHVAPSISRWMRSRQDLDVRYNAQDSDSAKTCMVRPHFDSPTTLVLSTQRTRDAPEVELQHPFR